MIETRKSDPSKPVRLMIYGVEGVGKSTLGAKSESPIFISPEGGTDQLVDAKGNPIEEMPHVNSWDSMVGALAKLTNETHKYKTLVLDSADWIEMLAHQRIVGSSDKDIIRVNGGFGAGYRESQRMHVMLINALSDLRNKKGMNIIVTAHAHVKQVKDPSALEDYDGYEPKMHEFVSSVWREWVDILAFAKFFTATKFNEDNTKARAFNDGSRKIYCVKDAAFQAKNRYGIPRELNFTEKTWGELMGFVKKGIVTETPEQVYSEIQELLKTMTDETTKQKAVAATEKDKSNLTKLVAIRKQLKTIKGEKHVN